MKQVYFIQSGPRGPIKIGVAENVHKRMAMLQVGNPAPLALMAAVPGSFELERDLHARFSCGRIAYEWFKRDTPGLLETIEHVLREGVIPALPDDGEPGGACHTCGWPAEQELVERGGYVRCWCCLKEAAAEIVPPVAQNRKG